MRKLPFSTVRKALKLLWAFEAGQGDWSMTELSDYTGLSKSDTSRLLNLLAEEGVLDRDERTLRYRLGLRLYRLGSRVVQQGLPHEHIRKTLHEIAGLTGYTCYLSALDHRELVIVDVVPGRSRIQVVVPVGDRYPAHATVAGKAILSARSDGEIRELFRDHPLEALTDRTITDLGLFLKEIQEVRARGYALVVDETFPGVTGVAIRLSITLNGRPCALSVALPSYDARESLFADLAQLLRTQAQQAGLI